MSCSLENYNLSQTNTTLTTLFFLDQFIYLMILTLVHNRLFVSDARRPFASDPGPTAKVSTQMRETISASDKHTAQMINHLRRTYPNIRRRWETRQCPARHKWCSSASHVALGATQMNEIFFNFHLFFSFKLTVLHVLIHYLSG